jgi:hypothetical protein
MLKLTRTTGGVSAEEVWSSKRVRIHFGNAVRLGQRIYASNGGLRIRAVCGNRRPDWGHDMAGPQRHPLDTDGAGDRLIILDEDGNLVLATPGDAGLTVHAKSQIQHERAWTVPTLGGTTLYVRDRHQILALDLGRR